MITFKNKKMGLFDKLRNEFIDIIDWTDNTNDTVVYKFPRFQNEIKMGAKLTVRESQIAVFMNEGQIADVFQPGMHTLSTQNMPILSTLILEILLLLSKVCESLKSFQIIGENWPFPE